MNKKQCYMTIAFMLATPLVLADNSFAGVGGAGDGISSVLEKILELMTGNIAKTLYILVIAGCGYLAMLGQLAWRILLNVSFGVGLIIGATSIGNLLYS